MEPVLGHDRATDEKVTGGDARLTARSKIPGELLAISVIRFCSLGGRGPVLQRVPVQFA